jgi:alkylated DNA repair dioxygenase AlkB
MKMKQASLFQASSASLPNIAGLQYLPDFIDAKTEALLIQAIDAQLWITELKRRVQHYGYIYDYKARCISQDLHIGAIPDWLASLCDDLHVQDYFKRIPDQVIVNEYLPGQGIAAHIDCVPCFGETIASLSLGSACVMDFAYPQAGAQSSLLLEPSSLLILSGDARYHWKHAIASRKTDRYNGQIIQRGRRLSLTFRTMILDA